MSDNSKGMPTHKNCETCKGFEQDIQKRKQEIKNLESNYLRHIGDSK